MKELINLTFEEVMSAINLGSDYTSYNWPWGRKERCRMHFWIESTERGERFIKQSSKGGKVFKPKKSTYTTQATLIQISGNKIGHVEWNVNYKIFGVTIEDNSYKSVTFFDDEARVLYRRFFGHGAHIKQG